MEFQAANLSISCLIETHQHMESCKEGFLRLFADAHGRGSGTEKGVLARFAPKQEKRVYLSTSLGYENETHIDLIQIRNERQKLYTFLEAQLDILKRNDAKLGYDGWVDFRHIFTQNVELRFRKIVADTRRSLNDVMLFDQTMATVAFFKAALAYVLLKGWKEPSTNDIAYKYRWRLLRIGLNGPSFWGNSMRIGDILAREELVTEALDEVKILLETAYPLGTEAYRDENGSIFIIPDIDSLPSDIDSAQTLESLIQGVALRNFAGEATFLKLLPSESTRNTLSFGEIVARPLQPPIPDIDYLRLAWRDQEKVKDICPVCGQRPQSSNIKTSTREICDICAKRRDNRSIQWFKDLSSTIWIDEIADNTGRLALLTAQFDLRSWLSGAVYNTIHSFNIESRLLYDPKRKIQYDFALADLITDIQIGLADGSKLPDFRKRSLLGKLILDDNRDRILNTVKAFYTIRLTDTDLKNVPGFSEAERLALEMIRLTPSFSRIHRVWQTTQEFWQNIAANLSEEVGKTNLRLRIRGIFKGIGERLGISHTYELNAEGFHLSVTYVAEGEFLTVDNLCRISVLLKAQEESCSDSSGAVRHMRSLLLQAQFVVLEEPTGYGNPKKPLGKLQITHIAIDATPYTPAIPENSRGYIVQCLLETPPIEFSRISTVS